MEPTVATPPIERLLDVTAAMESAGLTCALGGSGLLAALGLTDSVRDWDLTTDANVAMVRKALGSRSFDHVGSDELHADQKLMLHGSQVEVIVGFAFHTGGQVVRIPTRVSTRWCGAPVGSPEGWAIAYSLMDRTEKAERLWLFLEEHGADRAVVDEMLAEPLAPELARRLRSLPVHGS